MGLWLNHLPPVSEVKTSQNFTLIDQAVYEIFSGHAYITEKSLMELYNQFK